MKAQAVKFGKAFKPLLPNRLWKVYGGSVHRRGYGNMVNEFFKKKMIQESSRYLKDV
jgi:hypothetical protein